jgi:hypothetical protein
MRGNSERNPEPEDARVSTIEQIVARRSRVSAATALIPFAALGTLLAVVVYGAHLRSELAHPEINRGLGAQRADAPNVCCMLLVARELSLA